MIFIFDGVTLQTSHTLCGSKKEAAKHVPDKMVVIKKRVNRERTQATTKNYLLMLENDLYRKDANFVIVPL